VQPREAPVSFPDEQWVAVGKPCLSQRCGHPHADHISGEGMECDRCDCPKFVGFARPDDRGCGRHPGRWPDAQQGRGPDRLLPTG
jgi:hypothetical protein